MLARAVGQDGFLPTQVSQTIGGAEMGTVRWTYSNDLVVESERVGGETPLVIGYYDDGLLTQAGALKLDRDPAHGMVMGTSLSDSGASVSTTRGYSLFGELQSGFLFTIGR
jgi:hypothetical protein